MGPKWAWLFVVFTLGQWASCGGDSTRCVAGTTNPCYCPGGLQGTQICLADHTYDVCECQADAGPVDGGAPDAVVDAAVPDAGPDAAVINQPVWAALAAVGGAPGRHEHGAIYDSANQAMVIYGGNVGDTWRLTLSATPTWSQLPTPPSATPNSVGIPAAYDPVSGRMLVTGPCSTCSDSSSVWGLTLGGSPAWSELLFPQGPPVAPLERRFFTLVLDAAGQRIILFGGIRPGSGYVRDAWSLDLSALAWTEILAPSLPGLEREKHTAVWDNANQRMIVFGGVTNSGDTNSVWSLELAGAPTWVELLPAGTLPAPRQGHSAIYDAQNQRMVIYGGWPGFPMNDVWSLSLGANPTWTRLFPTGDTVPDRAEHSAIYDSANQRMIVFGGSGDPSDVWEMSLPAP